MLRILPKLKTDLERFKKILSTYKILSTKKSREEQNIRFLIKNMKREHELFA